MGKSGCCSENIGLQKGPWSAEEDELLTNFIQVHGEGNWKSLPVKAGLLRCGKSCRLRWMNYLRPNIKRGNITSDEVDIIIKMHALIGNRWSLIAGRLPGRTDNEIKNYWNTRISKKMRVSQGKNDRKSCSTSTTTTNNNNGGCGGRNHQRNQRVKDKKLISCKKNIVEGESTKIFTPKPIRVTSSSLTTRFLTRNVFDTGNCSTAACCGNSGGTDDDDDDEGKNCKLIKDEACIDGNNRSNGLGIDEECHDREKTLDMVYEEYLQLLNN